MKDIMEIARAVKSLEPEAAEKEILKLISEDKQWLGEIVKMYVESILPDVLGIKNLVEEYLNPIVIELEEQK